MTLVLPFAVSCATAAVACAAELKDPAELARAWNQAATEVAALKAPTFSLRNVATPPPAIPVQPIAVPPVWERDQEAPSPRMRGDEIRPDPHFNKRIRGAKPYEFNGEQ